MKKNSKLISVFTYIIIVLLIVGSNIIFISSTNSIKKSAINLKENFEYKTSKMDINEDEEKIVQLYSDYNLKVEEHYKSFGRVFINIVVTLLVIVSLALVIFGLSRRVNTNKNKGIYNSIVLAGITCIIFLIWFVVNMSNAFELLF